MKILYSIIFVLYLSTSYCGEIIIYTTADLHGRAENFASLENIIKKPQDAIRVDCGDTFTGTALSVCSNGKIMSDLMLKMNFDIWVAGNHDFELPLSAFLPLKNIILGADWTHKKLSFLLPDIKIIERNGIKIGFIGLTDPKMPFRLAPNSPWQFFPWREKLDNALDKIMQYNPNMIVLVAHAGLYTPLNGGFFKFIKNYPEIDLVIGAHSHKEIAGQKIGANTYFVQAGCYGKVVGKIIAIFDDNNKQLIQIKSALLTPKNRKLSQQLKAIIKKYKDKYNRYLHSKISTLPFELRLPYKREFNLPFGKYGAKALREVTNSDVAIFSLSVKRWNFRILNRENLYKLIPYENKIFTIHFTPKELKLFLEEELKFCFKNRNVIYVDGKNIKISDNGKLLIGNLPNKISVAMSEYILMKNSISFKKIKNFYQPIKTMFSERCAILSFFQKALKGKE